MIQSLPFKPLAALAVYLSAAAMWGAGATALPLRLELDSAETIWLQASAWAVWLLLSGILCVTMVMRWSSLPTVFAPGGSVGGAIHGRDPLTNLANRDAFLSRLRQTIDHAKRDQRLAALLLIDLDRFKNVNDTLGQSVGDALLRLAARRIDSAVRDSDTVARLSGDEFAVVVPDVDDFETVEALAVRLCQSIARPFGIEGNEIVTTASIGITVFSGEDWDVDQLLRNAEVAVYRAKETGRNSHHFYVTEMASSAHRRARIEIDLRSALERNELSIHYQPQVNFSTGEIVGVEALMRWQHPEHGWISPVEFIPVAEECGLILPLSHFALRQACTQGREWQDAGLPPIQIAVNFSATQFRHAGVATEVASILKETGLDGHWLEVELTESVVLRDPERVNEALNHLRTLGVTVALDDFGTGYSSLSYLKRLPIDKLKIDRSFVCSLDIDANDAAIVTAVIALGHSLNLDVIAEGVETDRVVRLLMNLGCTQGQGYYYCRPLPVEEITAVLAAGRITPALAAE